jgi:hypothetical protein
MATLAILLILECRDWLHILRTTCRLFYQSVLSVLTQDASRFARFLCLQASRAMADG